MTKIFDCNKKSLSRWINRYKTDKNVKKQSRNTPSYKVKSKHVKYALELIKDNKHSTMEHLEKKLKFKKRELNKEYKKLRNKIKENIKTLIKNEVKDKI